MGENDERRMYWHTVDHDDGRQNRRAWVDRGFWLNNAPRLMPICRLFGHRAVVDGTEGRFDEGARWVARSRCGVRASPQGALDPARWQIGSWCHLVMDGQVTRTEQGIERRPGPWPTSPRSTIGGQVVLAGGYSGVSAKVAVGSAGDEHKLSGHIHLGKLAALYLHTEGHGEGLRRRLNPTRWGTEHPYDTRQIGVSVHDGKLWWELWAPEGRWSSRDPKWQQGSVSIDPREWVRGRVRYWHEDVGPRVPGTIRMAHGDDHEVTLQLQNQTCGRERGGPRTYAWVVDVDVPSPGISTRPHSWKDGTLGFGVKVSAASIENGTWREEALDAAALRMSEDRSRYGYRAPSEATA